MYHLALPNSLSVTAPQQHRSDIPHERNSATRSNTEHCFEEKNRRLADLQALANGFLTLHHLEPERSSVLTFKNNTFTFVKIIDSVSCSTANLIFPQPLLSLTVPPKLPYTGRFIKCSGITKNYYRRTVGYVFTTPEQIEETTQFPPPSK